MSERTKKIKEELLKAQEMFEIEKKTRTMMSEKTPAQAEKYDRCVDKVKAKGGDVNAYAVCQTSVLGNTGEDTKKSIEEVKKDDPWAWSGQTPKATRQTQVQPSATGINGAGTGGMKGIKRGLKGMQSLAGFDPWAKDNRQIVANCKKHRTQGHTLSEKCKKILAMVDAQERARGGKAKEEEGKGVGSGAPYTDLNVAWGSGRDDCSHKEQFGSDLTESEKYYSDIDIKAHAGKTGDDPFKQKHKVRPANCYGHRCKGCRYVTAPIFDTAKMKEQKTKQLLNDFFKDPKAFMRMHSEFAYETIVIKSILAEVLGEDEEGMDWSGAEAPQPMAASASEDEGAWYLGIDDIRKVKKLLDTK